MKQDLPPVTVLATFNDRVAAEIACALLSEASIHPGEPEPAADGTWFASVRGLHPDLAVRTKVILRSAGANDITVARLEERAAPCCEHTTVHFREQGNVLPAVVQETLGRSLPAQR